MTSEPITPNRDTMFVRSISSSLLALFLALCATARAQDQSIPHQLSPILQVRPLADGVWLHTWWTDSPEWGRFSSNGLIVVSGGEALLIDTPGNDTLTEQLLRWTADSLGVPIRRAILTHAHDDRMGGIGALKRAGVVSYSLPGTAERAERQHWPRPDSLLADEQLVHVGTRSVMTWFPGPGHTPDNLVVWLDGERILYGGCLVKPENSRTIGNLGDAVVEQWPTSIRRLISRFPAALTVIPGHGTVGGTKALQRTLELLAELKEK